MRQFFMVCAALSFCAATAGAQTKVTGTAQCAKPDPAHVIPVGNVPDHSLVVEQSKSTCTKPMEIGGDESKEGVSTATGDYQWQYLEVSRFSCGDDGERRQGLLLASGYHVE